MREMLSQWEATLGRIDLRRQQRLAETARNLRGMVDRAMEVDAAAAAALRSLPVMNREPQRDADGPGDVEPEADARALSGRVAGGQPSDESMTLEQQQGRLTQALQQAAGSLALREARIQRDLIAAQAMIASVQRQEEARAVIAQQAAVLEQAAIQPADDSSAEAVGQAAEQLQRAAEGFAESQREIGRRAVEVSRQRDVANQPLREGLQAASDLAASIEAGAGAAADAPAGDSTAAADPAGDAAQAGRKADATADPPLPEQASGAASREGADSQTSRADDNRVGIDDDSAPDSLGSGLIPRSPETTARQIAGRRAMEQAEAASQASTQDATSQADSQAGSESGASGQAKAGQQGKGADAAPTAQDEASTAAESSAKAGGSSGLGADAEAGADSAENELWFLRLPASLQQQLRNRPRQQAPPGYRQRMRKYFGGG